MRHTVYMTAKETAQKWGVDSSFVLRLAREGRIEGAMRFGRSWMIPRSAEKPIDGRSKSAKKAKQPEEFFRFPMFLDLREKDCNPPLSYEEELLRQAQTDIHACRFEAAKQLILPLSEEAESRYVRIAALFHRCQLAEYENDQDDFNCSLYTFRFSLSDDFPYKKEMQLLRYWLEADFGYYSPLTEGLHFSSEGAYHRSAWGTAAALSVYALTNGDFSLFPQIRLEIYELACLLLEQEGQLFEAQMLHCGLVSAYQMQANNSMMITHLHRALEIAFSNELNLNPAILTYYYPDVAKKALSDFPVDFAKRVRTLGCDLHDRYVEFSKMQGKEPYWSILADSEFALVSYAVLGISNREISRMLNVSEKTVSNRFGEVYAKLNVKNKAELVALANTTHGGKASALASR